MGQSYFALQQAQRCYTGCSGFKWAISTSLCSKHGFLPIPSGKVAVDYPLLRQISSICNQLPTMDADQFSEEFMRVSPPKISLRARLDPAQPALHTISVCKYPKVNAIAHCNHEINCIVSQTRFFVRSLVLVVNSTGIQRFTVSDLSRMRAEECRISQ